MMRMSRRSMLGGTAATVLMRSSAHAQSAEFTYKLAHNQPTTHPLHLQAAEAAKRIKADTGGKVDIQVFPSSQLGSDTDTLSQLRSGAVQLFTLSPLILSTFVPKAAITGIPFAFPDYDAVWKALDGEVGAYVRGQIAAASTTVASNAAGMVLSSASVGGEECRCLLRSGRGRWRRGNANWRP